MGKTRKLRGGNGTAVGSFFPVSNKKNTAFNRNLKKLGVINVNSNYDPNTNNSNEEPFTRKMMPTQSFGWPNDNNDESLPNESYASGMSPWEYIPRTSKRSSLGDISSKPILLEKTKQPQIQYANESVGPAAPGTRFWNRILRKKPSEVNSLKERIKVLEQQVENCAKKNAVQAQGKRPAFLNRMYKGPVKGWTNRTKKGGRKRKQK